MKKKLLKALSLVMAAVALVAITIAGTAAYFTSSSAVTNTFTVGNVGIYMYESPVNSNGVISSTELVNGMKTSSGNNYHLQPGGNYAKDPTIYVTAGSDSSFLFVKARNQISTIESDTNLSTNVKHGLMKEQMLKNGFVLFEETPTGNVYIFAGTLTNNKNVPVDEAAYNANFTTDDEGNIKMVTRKNISTPVGGKDINDMQTIDLFTQFSVITDTENTVSFNVYGGAKVTLTAFAIQTTGFVDDNPSLEGAKTAEQKAWDAIVATYPYESGSGN